MAPVKRQNKQKHGMITRSKKLSDATQNDVHTKSSNKQLTVSDKINGSTTVHAKKTRVSKPQKSLKQPDNSIEMQTTVNSKRDVSTKISDKQLIVSNKTSGSITVNAKTTRVNNPQKSLKQPDNSIETQTTVNSKRDISTKLSDKHLRVANNVSTSTTAKKDLNTKGGSKNCSDDIEKMLLRYRTFNVGDILFAKMKGFPLWPCKIESLPVENNMVNVVFYGDKTRAKMYKTTLTTFEEGAKNFVPGDRILLNKAVKEALYEKHGQSFDRR